jgi:hypothetical protein
MGLGEVFGVGEGCLAGAFIGLVTGLLSMTIIVIMRKSREDKTLTRLLAGIAGGLLGGTAGGLLAALLPIRFEFQGFLIPIALMLLGALFGSIIAFENLRAR